MDIMLLSRESGVLFIRRSLLLAVRDNGRQSSDLGKFPRTNRKRAGKQEKSNRATKGSNHSESCSPGIRCGRMIDAEEIIEDEIRKIKEKQTQEVEA